MSDTKQPVEEPLDLDISTLGTHIDHKDMSVTYLIAEALNAREHEQGGEVILPAFMHGMLAGLKIAGK